MAIGVLGSRGQTKLFSQTLRLSKESVLATIQHHPTEERIARAKQNRLILYTTVSFEA